MMNAIDVLTELPGDSDLRREIRDALRQRPKSLPCKLFYDDLGSRLFEQICELDEYYLTRTELAILRKHVAEMADLLGPHCRLVEFGSGSGIKTELLLRALDRPAAYVPVDISRSALVQSVAMLRRAHPGLPIQPVWGDYTRPFRLPEAAGATASNAVFFPGSTIGNFAPREALSFLCRVRAACGPAGALLVGVDLKKERSVLESAYNDRAGVTAEFNRNILRVVNRVCDANFQLESFRHRAPWNEREGRVEMQLVSERAQAVQVSGDTLWFGAAEPIVTEHCYKYGIAQFRELASECGFDVERVWTDPAERFSVQLLRAR